MDKNSNAFQEFKAEMKQKLNALLLDRIMESKKEVAAQMVGDHPIFEEIDYGDVVVPVDLSDEKISPSKFHNIYDITPTHYIISYGKKRYKVLKKNFSKKWKKIDPQKFNKAL